MPPQTLRIFVSSPGDVAEERVLAARVIQRLQDALAAYVILEPIFWEHELSALQRLFRPRLSALQTPILSSASSGHGWAHVSPPSLRVPMGVAMPLGQNTSLKMR